MNALVFAVPFAVHIDAGSPASIVTAVCKQQSDCTTFQTCATQVALSPLVYLCKYQIPP